MPDRPRHRAAGAGETREAMDHSDAIARALTMNAEALRSLGQIVEGMKGPDIRFDVDHMTQTHAPDIRVDVQAPDMRPLAEATERALGKVADGLSELQMPPPVVQVTPDIRAELVEKRDKTPKLISRHEAQKITRDRDDKIVGTETEVKYQYGKEQGE